MSINIAQEAEAACLDVGGYLVEPRSTNREDHLEEITEVSNPYTVFTNSFFSEPSPLSPVTIECLIQSSRFCTMWVLLGPGGSVSPSEKVKVNTGDNGFGHLTMGSLIPT